MNDLILFKYGESEIRVVEKNGNPYWVALDVCKALDIKNSRQALTRVDADEKDDVILNDTIGREQKMVVVNEPGLYSLIFCSRKEEALKFKRWITHEVLPSIRKTGAYVSPIAKPKSSLVLQAQQLLEMAIKQEELEEAQLLQNQVQQKQQAKLEELEKRTQEVLDISKHSSGYLTVTAYAMRLKVFLTTAQAQKIGFELKRFCTFNGFEVHKEPHPTLPNGVNVYPLEVLESNKYLFMIE